MIGAVTSNRPESTIDAPIMTMNAPATTVQWRALLWVFVATTSVILRPLVAGAYSAPSHPRCRYASWLEIQEDLCSRHSGEPISAPPSADSRAFRRLGSFFGGGIGGRVLTRGDPGAPPQPVTR